MEDKIRIANLYIVFVSYLSPPERAKAQLNTVSKTFRTACESKVLLRADAKYAEQKIKEVTDRSPEWVGPRARLDRTALKPVTDKGYIAFYWLNFILYDKVAFEVLTNIERKGSFYQLKFDFLHPDPSKPTLHADFCNILGQQLGRMMRQVLREELADMLYGCTASSASDRCWGCQIMPKYQLLTVCRKCITHIRTDVDEKAAGDALFFLSISLGYGLDARGRFPSRWPVSTFESLWLFIRSYYIRYPTV